MDGPPPDTPPPTMLTPDEVKRFRFNSEEQKFYEEAVAQLLIRGYAPQMAVWITMAAMKKEFPRLEPLLSTPVTLKEVKP